MKILILVSVTSLSVTACASREIPATTLPESNLSFTQSDIDLGRVFVGTTHAFGAVLSNSGEVGAKIGIVKMSCACVEVTLGQNICGPGEQVTVRGSVRIGMTAGKFRHRVTVAEEGSSQLASFDLVGEGEEVFGSSPKVLVLRPDIFADGGVEGDITIHNRGEESVDFFGPQNLPRGFEVRLSPSTLHRNTSGKLRVRVRGDASLMSTPSSFDIQVATSHHAQRTLVVRVDLQPKSGVQFTPSSVRLGVESREDLLRGKIVRLQMRSIGEGKATIQKITAPPFLELAGQESRGRDLTELRFRFVDRLSGVALDGEIYCKVAIQPVGNGGIEQKELDIKIPVSGLIKR